ncbi:MAG: 3-hydroxyacyl-ACP dehydratase FabZ family protein [Eubacteriales bacterium]|jgi:3-hydroxyacyl-[acyl-carrier-protein] dehydratase
MMNREEIMKLLPHRDAMLLLDSVACIETEDGAVARGRYLVRGDEWFLSGHFPGNPVVPGVVLCEILAQSACALLAGKTGDGVLPMFTGMDGVRFRLPVRPGDTFETECRIVRAKHPFYFASGRGCVGGRLCVQAEFSFALVSGQ